MLCLGTDSCTGCCQGLGPFSSDGLAQLGIAHPLHRRRILRELECFQYLKDPDSLALKSRGRNFHVTSSSRSSGGPRDLRDLQDLCLQRPSRPTRRRSFVQDPRWPFLLIECLPPDSAKPGLKTAAGGFVEQVSATPSHAKRRQLKLSTLRGASVSTEPKQDAGPEPSLSSDGSLAPPTGAPDTPEPDEDVEPAEADESDDWEEWLQSRLHSWGMLSLVDDVLHAACSGNLSACTEMMAKVSVHGKEFEQSLAKTPLPSYIHSTITLPQNVTAPSNIWDWLLWRMELLEDAEYRVTTLLGKASNLVDSVVGASIRAPARSESTKHANSSDRRKTLNVKKLMQSMHGTQTLAAPSLDPARSGSIGSQPPRTNSIGSQAPGRSSSGNSQNNDLSNPERSAGQSGLQRFKKIASLVLSHVRAKKQDGMVLNTKLLTCISMQTKVTQTQNELAALAREVDEWPPLISQSRSSCEDMRARLREASQTLFERFVDLRQHVEVELRELTIGDQGIVDCPHLEGKIIDVQRELSSSLLLGDFALQRAEQLGVSLQCQGIAAPPNPWEGCVQLVEPPWEASFLRALRKLEPLRRNLSMRRQGTAHVDHVAHAKSEKRRTGGSHALAIDAPAPLGFLRRSLKAPKQLRPGQSIPEELLSRLSSR